MSHGNSLFAVSEETGNLAKLMDVSDEDALSIIYEPDLGSLRLDELLNKHNSSDVEYIYESMDRILDSNTYNVSVSPNTNLVEGNKPLYEVELEDVPEETEPETEEDKEKISNDLIRKNDEILELKGFIVADSFRDFYKFKIHKDNSQNKPVILPYTLSLTMYGISSILNGDTFKVDYLPKAHLDKTYLQTMKVVNAIGRDGWFTTLETQFRTDPAKYVGRDIQNIDRTKLRISPTVFNKIEFHQKCLYGMYEPIVWAVGDFTSWATYGGAFNLMYPFTKFIASDFIAIEDVSPYMTDCKIHATPGTLDYVVSFICAEDEKLKDQTIRLRHSRFGSYMDRAEFPELIAGMKKHGLKIIRDDYSLEGSMDKDDFEDSFDDLAVTEDNYQGGEEVISLMSNLYGQEDVGWLDWAVTAPPIYLVPGQEYIMMVKDDSFAFAYGYMKKSIVPFFDEYYGEFKYSDDMTFAYYGFNIIFGD